MLVSTFLFASFAGFIASSPTSSPLVLHEKRLDLLNNPFRTRRVDGETLLPIRIALKQRNLEHGYDHLMETSHPESPKYGQHWTADQVHDAFAPHKSSVQTIKSWLQSSGILEDEMVSRKGWLAFDIPASEAERLFSTKYFEHEDLQGNVRVGCDRYSILIGVQE